MKEILKGLKELRASKTFDIRFSEVDSMNVVWHGSYALYLEDAREAFGAKYGLDYMNYFHHHCYAPIVEETIRYHKPLRYGSKPRIDIIYRPTIAAKVIFDYEIYDTMSGDLMATGHSVQAFIDTDYQIILYRPAFYQAWQKQWGVFAE